jgi:acyl dehydratase
MLTGSMQEQTSPTSWVEVGDSAAFTKTVTESDVAMFCEVSGDFDPIHVDAGHASRTVFGQRIAHGALSIAVLSAASSMISKLAVDRGNPGVSISMGYDRIRFLKPVFIGDTLSASYTVEDIDAVSSRTRGRMEVRNQRNELVLAGVHLMKWLPPPGPSTADAAPAVVPGVARAGG